MTVPHVYFGVGGTIETALLPYHLVHLRSFLQITCQCFLSAEATSFVSSIALEAITRHKVIHQVDRLSLESMPSHIIAEEGRPVVVYPATARILAECTAGSITCPVTRLVAFANPKDVIIVPFIHRRMQKSVYLSHSAALHRRGMEVLLPPNSATWAASPWRIVESIIANRLGLKLETNPSEVFYVEDN